MITKNGHRDWEQLNKDSIIIPLDKYVTIRGGKSQKEKNNTKALIYSRNKMEKA